MQFLSSLDVSEPIGGMPKVWELIQISFCSTSITTKIQFCFIKTVRKFKYLVTICKQY